MLSRRSVLVSIAAFILTVLAADYLAGLAPRYMLVLGPVVVSLGTPLIGIALAVRDTLQKRHGNAAVKQAIGFAGMASVLFAASGGTPWTIILASACAFLVSESVDYLLYTYARLPNENSRIVVSNLLSSPLDSIVFVALAFGFSGEFVISQMAVKMAATLIYVALRWLLAQQGRG